jgi:predicted metal-binding membrane protein
MNLLWIVPVALFVLAEKCLPGGERTRKAGGALLIAWGAAALFMAA